MHVLHELVCGVRGAELGTVDIYRRGTSTRVTYYTSFEGDGSTTPTSATTLDANGGGEFYVNETCDVVVRDSGGTEIRRFTSAPAASAVEAISQSFTGTDYDSGASAHTKPTTLSTVLDGVYTSFGARDWNVLYGGSSITIQSLAAKVGTLFFNVKDPDYGATGDGTTDDTAAIQEALDAASAAGGGIVFFPKGTYAVSSTGLSVAAKVSLLGAGPDVSIIALSSDAGLGVMVFAASTVVQTIDSIGFVPSVVTASRNSIRTNDGAVLAIRRCHFGSAAFPTGRVRPNHASTDIYLEGCVFYLDAAVGAVSGNVGRVTVFGCTFILPATFNATVIEGGPLVNGSIVAFSRFDASSMAAGTGTLFSQTSPSVGGRFVAIGNICADPAGGTLNVMVGPGADSSGANRYLEIGNSWGDALVRSALFGGQATATTYTGSFMMERERRRYYTADDTAAVAASALTYAEVEIMRTTNGAQTVTIDGPGAVNCDFTLAYHNNHAAGGGTITMAGNVKGLTTFTVNADCVSYFFFKSVHRGTSKHWVLIDSTENQAE